MYIRYILHVELYVFVSTGSVKGTDVNSELVPENCFVFDINRQIHCMRSQTNLNYIILKENHVDFSFY